MKIYLIAALFLAALVVAHAEDVELPKQDVELPEQSEQQDQPELEVNDSTEKDEEDTEDSPGTEEDAEEIEDDEAEDEEEDPEKRRRGNALSNISCRKLKLRGYCRRPFIKRLCAATCGCSDKLSRISCLRLRAYRKCRVPTVRRYCKKTCGGCGPKPSDPCRYYRILNQLNRRQSRPRGNVLLCDQRGFAKRWYRFVGLAGIKMPTRAPPKNRCGTHAPGWMRGSYPRRNGETVSRKVCFHWSSSKCKWSTQIKVKRCRWGRSYYYVFKLGPTPVCHLRYCGNR